MTFGQRRTRPSDLLKGVKRIDYKNIELLERFLEGGGRLRSRRRTRTPAKQQRKITAAVKRARLVALIPYTAEHERLLGSARSRTRGRRDDRPARGGEPRRDGGAQGEIEDDELLEDEIVEMDDTDEIEDDDSGFDDSDDGDYDDSDEDDEDGEEDDEDDEEL